MESSQVSGTEHEQQQRPDADLTLMGVGIVMFTLCTVLQWLGVIR